MEEEERTGRMSMVGGGVREKECGRIKSVGEGGVREEE
jgi:hypothetical protein